MATLTPNFSIKPRPSTETDRRHLLADSVAPSEAASIISYGDGDRTPRAQSPSRASQITDTSYARRETIAESTPARRPYKGFPSEEEYLEALREWAEGKKYLQYDRSLVGFYGHTTMQEIASRPAAEIGLRKWRRERKARKEEKKAERRNTVT